MAYRHDYKIRHKDYTMEKTLDLVAMTEREHQRRLDRRFWIGFATGVGTLFGMSLLTGCSTTQQAVKEKPFYWEISHNEVRLYRDRVVEDGYVEKHLGDTYMIKQNTHSVNPIQKPQEKREQQYDIQF